MNVLKGILIVSATLLVAQCSGASVGKSVDKLNLVTLVENGGVISRSLFKSLNVALDAVKPNVNAILNEVSPELKKLVSEVINNSRATINEEQKRFDHVFTTLSKALVNLRPINACSDKISVDLTKTVRNFENEFVKNVRKVLNDHKKELDEVKTAVEKVVDKARRVFDKEVSDVVKCLTPGDKHSKECLNKEMDNVVSAVIEVGSQLVVVKETANESFSVVLKDVVESLLPVGVTTFMALKTHLNVLADCVSNLKG